MPRCSRGVAAAVDVLGAGCVVGRIAGREEVCAGAMAVKLVGVSYAQLFPGFGNTVKIYVEYYVAVIKNDVLNLIHAGANILHRFSNRIKFFNILGS